MQKAEKLLVFFIVAAEKKKKKGKGYWLVRRYISIEEKKKEMVKVSHNFDNRKGGEDATS